MIVFLDFEASSLDKKSFPVEVAWVFEDGRSQSRLIRPVAGWTDWSSEAEGIHGISRNLLYAEGIAAEVVAREMLETLGGHDLYASSPSWDGKWLSILLRAAGLPRHALRLRKSDDAFADVARSVLGEAASETDIQSLVADVIAGTEPASPAHRALSDAKLELHRWNIVRQTAEKRNRPEAK
jgi:hypothetical protein